MKPFISVRRTAGLCLLSMVALVPLPVFAGSESCEARSAATRVAVLELYTSEGCNSCPPADRWISALPARGFGPDRLIPLAFHVDYWDRLGWPDRMAKAQFTARQRMQAQRNRADVVYTPQLLLNGADYRLSLSDARLEDRLNEINRLPAAADMRLTQQRAASGIAVDLQVRLAGAIRASTAQTYVAIAENRLQSAVKAGENQGRMLHHDFVVRELIGPLPADQAGGTRWKSTIALHPDWKRGDLAIAAFVQDARDGEILQSLLAPLCAPR